MINADNERVWVKFHFRCQQGIENLTDQDAGGVVAGDREKPWPRPAAGHRARRLPRWKLHIQVMTQAQAQHHKHNPFDLTKVWPKADYPLIEVGVMELNRYPENYFAEVEQAAFSPANVVPGIGFSPDKMLQARLFSYGDAQRYRLGVNFNHIPVNAPPARSTVTTATAPCAPTATWGRRPATGPTARARGWATILAAGAPAGTRRRCRPLGPSRGRGSPEQPGNLFRLMTPAQRQLLFENTARAMGDAREEVKRRHIENCTKADPAYGAGVAKALGL